MPEHDTVACLACGQPCTIVGRTTLHYEPVHGKMAPPFVKGYEPCPICGGSWWWPRKEAKAIIDAEGDGDAGH